MEKKSRHRVLIRLLYAFLGAIAFSSIAVSGFFLLLITVGKTGHLNHVFIIATVAGFAGSVISFVFPRSVEKLFSIFYSI